MFYVPTEDDEMPPTSPVNKPIDREILSPRPARGEPRYSNNNSFNSYTFSKSKNNTAAATFNCCVCECEGTLQDTVQ